MPQNTDAILIIYPHGAGGRFLEMLLAYPETELTHIKKVLKAHKRLLMFDAPQGQILLNKRVFAIGVNDDVDGVVFAVYTGVPTTTLKLDK